MTSCGSDKELEILEAIEKFRKFYEEKMKDIDSEGGGDCLELQLQLQERWINDLTEQTRMMAKIVKELEEEATSRVQMLEEKLRVTSKTAYEDSSHKQEKEKPSEIEDILKKKTEEYETLKQSMLDMRSALTEEVACKHDMISALKKDIQQLEERCVQVDKQTAFKDDIIKELRKEIKQLKQQTLNGTLMRLKDNGRRVNKSSTVFTTIRHNPSLEKPKVSTVIYITEEKNEEKNKSSEMIGRSHSDTNLSESYLKDAPIKEKSKFTATNFNKTNIRGESSVNLGNVRTNRFIYF